ncbi:hypothetical protein [Actinoplanes solisilvae]|uniref:hypothetical protein n=1 Tax=Actinoplanes solisilvae TaxID=2486853 RepID=UPI000FD7D138|nr:hypothetical protein [Actinoplanes solisilvae]
MKRYLGAAAILLVASAGAVVLRADPPDVSEQLLTRLRTTLEQPAAAGHNHHGTQPAVDEKTPVVCGVHVYGFEPAQAAELADVRTVYGFHLCGVAEPLRPWDVAVKLAGPVIVDLSSDPPGVQVVEATETIRYVDRLREMFPPKYADLASKEALTATEMSDLRGRYDDAAGL